MPLNILLGLLLPVANPRHYLSPSTNHSGSSVERRLRHQSATGVLPADYEHPQKKKRADERTRTADLLITSELLYLLSYVGLCRALSIS